MVRAKQLLKYSKQSALKTVEEKPSTTFLKKLTRVFSLQFPTLFAELHPKSHSLQCQLCSSSPWTLSIHFAILKTASSAQRCFSTMKAKRHKHTGNQFGTL